MNPREASEGSPRSKSDLDFHYFPAVTHSLDTGLGQVIAWTRASTRTWFLELATFWTRGCSLRHSRQQVQCLTYQKDFYHTRGPVDHLDGRLVKLLRGGLSYVVAERGFRLHPKVIYIHSLIIFSLRNTTENSSSSVYHWDYEGATCGCLIHLRLYLEYHSSRHQSQLSATHLSLARPVLNMSTDRDTSIAPFYRGQHRRKLSLYGDSIVRGAWMPQAPTLVLTSLPQHLPR